MAKKNSGKKPIDVILIALSFVPFLNTFTLLHLGGKARMKNWTRNGWIVLAVNILLSIAVILGMVGQDVRVAEPNTATKPNVYDFVDRQTYDNLTYEEREALPEYYQYQDALDEWYNSPDYTDAYNANTSFHAAARGLMIGAQLGSAVANIIAFFYVISQSHVYFEATEKKAVLSRLSDEDFGVPAEKEAPPARTDDKPAPPAAVPRVTDVNTATADEIGSLPGLTIVHGKRAVQYREEHGAFPDTDTFFTEIVEKPHLIAKLGPLVTASAPDTPPEHDQPKPTRALDL